MKLRWESGETLISLDQEAVCTLVHNELTNLADYYQQCLNDYHTTDKFIAVFSTDKETDIKKLKKMIKALRRAAKHYKS